MQSSLKPALRCKMAGQPVLEELAGGPGEEEIDRLARQRPDIFPSVWSEVGFLYSVSMSTALMVNGWPASDNFSVLLLTASLGVFRCRLQHHPPKGFGRPSHCPGVQDLASQRFLPCRGLLLDRLRTRCSESPRRSFGRGCRLTRTTTQDMHGGYTVYMGGIAWFTVWSFIAGWAQNEIMIDVCRALQGIGPAAFLPTGLMLLGSFYRPGPRKNMSMGIYGAMAPVGFYLGIFFAGITAQYASWRWWFFIGSALCLSTLAVAYFSIPRRTHRRRKEVKMDWWGAALLSSGLILVVFAITDSAHAPRHWANPYIYLTFAAGVAILAVAVYVEGWVAESPLLPFDMFRVKYVRPLLLALIACWGSIGIFMLYATY
ncbi:Major facilitator superfamily [Macrophomina phaseolina MS6]|uniref:Major facilitator superfamily n=1 Tax=Macrophomina phaseolina (strain MS6) TaxID=1126212 RepID=K2S123_MACPH|nr:Major facilitator superfamily [Macrophomina phaseolina MS6]